jgi:hypothetical protein
LIELEVRTRSPQDFAASLRQSQLGPIQLSHVYTREAQAVSRTRQAIGRSEKVHFELVYVRTGGLIYRQYGKTLMRPLDGGTGPERSGRRFREIIQLLRNRAHDDTLDPDKQRPWAKCPSGPCRRSCRRLAPRSAKSS